MLTHASLMHPRTLWEIEAAMRKCIEQSAKTGYAARAVIKANGDLFFVAEHFRAPDIYGLTGFRFLTPSNQLCTSTVLKALRASAKGE